MSSQTDEGYGVISGEAELRFERVLPGPIERVWAHLTEPEKRGRWLASGAMERRVGGGVELVFEHARLTDHDEEPPAKYRHHGGRTVFSGRVTEWEPPRRLSFTWAESWGSDSEVSFELSSRDDGSVLLVLTHRRLPETERPGVASGWHTHLGILKAKLEGREPAPFWTTMARLEPEYETRLAR